MHQPPNAASVINPVQVELLKRLPVAAASGLSGIPLELPPSSEAWANDNEIR